MKKSVDFSRIHNNVKAIGKVFFDTSDCDAWVADKKCKSSLAIGGIVSNRLYESLSYELNFFPLKEDNYTWFIKYSCLDLLLVESMLERFGAYGVSRERIDVVGITPTREEHLGLYAKVDIHFDTYIPESFGINLSVHWSFHYHNIPRVLPCTPYSISQFQK